MYKKYLITYETADEINQRFEIEAMNESFAREAFYHEIIMGEAEDGSDREDIEIISVIEVEE